MGAEYRETDLKRIDLAEPPVVPSNLNDGRSAVPASPPAPRRVLFCSGDSRSCSPPSPMQWRRPASSLRNLRSRDRRAQHCSQQHPFMRHPSLFLVRQQGDKDIFQRRRDDADALDADPRAINVSRTRSASGRPCDDHMQPIAECLNLPRLRTGLQETEPVPDPVAHDFQHLAAHFFFRLKVHQCA